MKRVITIDGPSGAGKSTIAKRLATELGFEYLDTGALYRAVALYLRRSGCDENISDEEISRLLEGLKISFSDGRVFINNEDVTDRIRTPEIGHFSSVFSARAPVREFLMGVQRGFPEEHDTVAEGRDMGTVVFPDAWKKFFITASIEERTRRRFKQLQEMGKAVTLDEALRDVKERDERDSNRKIAPLKKPADAVHIDTTELSLEETLQCIKKHLGSDNSPEDRP
ncbi:MAG TPA: (d)CMP kinase [Nitrospirae bacterium]|nr:(d)CMP kinase [Nitrospirota bacterium]